MDSINEQLNLLCVEVEGVFWRRGVIKPAPTLGAEVAMFLRQAALALIEERIAARARDREAFIIFVQRKVVKKACPSQRSALWLGRRKKPVVCQKDTPRG